MEMQLNPNPNHLGMKLCDAVGTLSICGVGPGEEQDILDTNLQVIQSLKALTLLPCNEGEDDKQTQRYRNPTIECLANDLIVGHLLTYLDHTSTMFLSGLCRTIRSNRDFLNKTRIRLAPSAVDAKGPVDEITFLVNSDFPWTKMRLQVDGWTAAEYQQVVLNLLFKVVNLELYQEKRSGSGNDTEGLIGILGAAKSLRALSLVDSLLFVIGHDSVAFNSEIKENLENVESLCVTVDDVFILDPSRVNARWEFEWTVGTNFSTLANFPRTLTLFSYNSHATEPKLLRSLISLLEKHKFTLVSLDLHAWAWDPLSDAIKDVIFPCLKNLLVEGKGHGLEFDRIVRFINNQPPLLSLSVSLDGSTVSPRTLVDALLTHAQRLSNLNLGWKWDAPPSPDPPNVLDMVDEDDELDPGPAPLPVLHVAEPDFSWLKQLKNLQNVAIHQFALYDFRNLGNRATTGTIISSLPDGAREVRLAGACIGGGGNDSPEWKIESLGRLRHLTVLNLLQCKDALDNEILHFICSNVLQLTELGFSHCEKLTDVGLTGERNGERIGAGLRNLTNLRKLSIIACMRLSADGLMSAISFPELKNLDIEHFIGSSGEEVLQFWTRIARQNKMLETFGFCDYVLRTDSLAFESSMQKESGGRFKSLHNIEPLEPFLLRKEDKAAAYFYDDSTSDYSDYSDTSSDLEGEVYAQGHAEDQVYAQGHAEDQVYAQGHAEEQVYAQGHAEDPPVEDYDW